MFKQDKPKAEWTLIHGVTKGDQRYSFYMSAKGAVKITRHTPQGETRGIIMMGTDVADLVAVAEELPRVNQSFQDALPTIQENKAKAKEESRLEREKLAALNKAVKGLSAIDEQKARLLAQVEALTGKKVG